MKEERSSSPVQEGSATFRAAAVATAASAEVRKKCTRRGGQRNTSAKNEISSHRTEPRREHGSELAELTSVSSLRQNFQTSLNCQRLRRCYDSFGSKDDGSSATTADGERGKEVRSSSIAVLQLSVLCSP